MSPDPTLARLVEQADRTATAAAAAASRLRSYLDGETIEPDADLISLRDAERLYRKSNLTVRRWAKEEALGIELDGRWYLLRSLVRETKGA